jgi:hypothetical protein
MTFGVKVTAELHEGVVALVFAKSSLEGSDADGTAHLALRRREFRGHVKLHPLRLDLQRVGISCSLIRVHGADCPWTKHTLQLPEFHQLRRERKPAIVDLACTISCHQRATRQFRSNASPEIQGDQQCVDVA